MPYFDYMGTVFNKEPAQRIISCVPSLTELLYYLQLEERIVGNTRFCIYPPEARRKTRVGGTKTLKLDLINSLNPDFILTNKEENTKEQVEILQSQYKVYVSYPRTPDESIKLAEELGMILGADTSLIQQLKTQYNDILSKIKQIKPKLEGKTVFVPIWKKPWMSINHDTYIDSMLRIFGLKNVYSDMESRYPEIKIEELSIDPDFLLLPDEPYKFKEKDKIELQKIDIFANSEILLIDGSYLSWYGNRTVLGLEKLYQILLKNS